jgi:hypothetical protein
MLFKLSLLYFIQELRTDFGGAYSLAGLSTLLLASTKIQTTPAVKLISAAKSNALIQPKFVAM